jgi:hypothetical protein
METRHLLVYTKFPDLCLGASGIFVSKIESRNDGFRKDSGQSTRNLGGTDLRVHVGVSDLLVEYTYWEVSCIAYANFTAQRERAMDEDLTKCNNC